MHIYTHRIVTGSLSAVGNGHHLTRSSEINGVGTGIGEHGIADKTLDSYQSVVLGNNRARNTSYICSIRERVGIVDLPLILIDIELIAATCYGCLIDAVNTL